MGGSVISWFDGRDRWWGEKDGGRGEKKMEMDRRKITERKRERTGENVAWSDTVIQLSETSWQPKWGRERKENVKCDRGIR